MHESGINQELLQQIRRSTVGQDPHRDQSQSILYQLTHSQPVTHMQLNTSQATLPRPLAGSDQKTQIEQRREELQDAGVLSVRTPTGARPQAPLAATNLLPAINPFATQIGTKNGPQPLTRSNHKTEIEQLQQLQETREALPLRNNGG